MGILKDPDGKHIVLHSVSTVGRLSGSLIRIDDKEVSYQHATLRWRDGAWWVEDRGSKNGTWVEGTRVTAQGKLDPHSILHFGGKSKPRYVLVDAGPPCALALSLTTNRIFVAQDSILCIPSDSDPIAVLSREQGGQWWMEYGTEERKLIDGDLFECAGEHYRFHSGQEAVRTASNNTPDRYIRDAVFEFHVIGEQVIKLLAHHGNEVVRFSDWPAPYYTLLNLARRRAEDKASNVPMAQQGYVDRESFAQQIPDTAHGSNLLSRHASRIKRAFVDQGYVDAVSVIESNRAGMVRTGIESFREVPPRSNRRP